MSVSFWHRCISGKGECCQTRRKAFPKGVFMLDGDEMHEPERRDAGHDRWLAMQSAYAEYMHASEALECTHHSADESSTGERLQLAMLEGRQRVAFERYLESRMEFLEFRFDDSNRSGAAPAIDVECSPAGSRFAFVKARPFLEILAVILLSATAFSLVREKQHLRTLESSRDELQAALVKTRAEVQLLGQKMESLKPPEISAIHAVEHATHSPSRVGHAAAPRPLAPADQQRKRKADIQAKPSIAKKRDPVTGTQSPGLGAHGYYSFSLGPSRQFTRVGPIEVSLRSVDVRRKSANLSIVSDVSKWDVPHVEMNQPVRINVGGNQQPLELVLDRIDGNRLEGHLIENRPAPTDLRAGRYRSGLSTN
jgi:hypothetical protein